MTINVYINPNAIDGIRRVIEAQYLHLPKFGITPVDDPRKAHIICNHGAQLDVVEGVPSVHVGHGFMWSRQPWGDGAMEINKMVVESMRYAVAHTAPSEWVANAIRRGGFWYPEVVYHGVDADRFKPSPAPQNYVLWNKARTDFVSDPGDMLNVAEIAPNIQFWSTFGSQNRAYKNPKNVKVLGVIPYGQMSRIVSEAGVYLATTRETFGIGTLEALASGVPIAGWDWGGQSEIVRQGETGYLAPPGDYKALKQCIEMCLADRARLSANAVQDARENWKWEPRIQQYADIFKHVYGTYYAPRPKVSVIVTTYNLDRYLPQCLDSVKTQTFKDWECLVVDDAQSQDTERIVSDYAKSDKRFRYCPTPVNRGLPGARNFGLQSSTGAYIRHLDADDFLAANALGLEADALDKDRSVDIVYGHLEVVREDGSRVLKNGEPVRGGWPGKEYNWYEQMAHMNQLPSCVMARREVYERSGGYRERMKRNEDAEFWCRVTSLGFRAKKFTEAVTYFHRERHDSKGATEWHEQGAEPDWTAWFPWRMGASNFDQARQILRTRGYRPKNPHLVPFGAQGDPMPDMRFWYVHDYTNPVVSIILTVGPGHEKYMIDALDSIQGQTFPDWECIVVNDTGQEWAANIMGAPWAKVVNAGFGNVSKARNLGYEYARGKFVIWMDADDYWLPWLLERMVSLAEHNHGVIFSDLILDENGKFTFHRYSDFDAQRVVSTMQYPGSSILYPRDIVDAVRALQGGYDPDIPGMEDWDFQIAVHSLDFCAFRIPDPLFVYRLHTTTKREADYAKIDDIVAYIDRKWAAHRKGAKRMCGCRSPKQPPGTIPQSLLSSSGNFSEASIQKAIETNDTTMMVNVEYIGDQRETFSIRSRVDRGVNYRFGNNDGHRTRAVFVGDANFLLGLNKSGKPQYRIVSSVAVVDANDPAAFVGQPITA